MEPFKISFDHEGNTIDAIVETREVKGQSVYDVRYDDKKQSLQYSVNDELVAEWVNQDGDTDDFIQAAGEAIEEQLL